MKKYSILFIFLLIATLTFSQSKKQIKALDTYYEKVLNEWNIPGMAIAIVSGDKIIFEKGYGFADLEKKKKVNENTLFAVASNSKAFTGMSIAQLVDQNRISWDDKVIDYLPYYRSYNNYVTNETTVEDLLCHRNGLKTFSGDLLWYGTDLKPEEIIWSAQYLEPIYNFRTHFGYNNIQFLIAGMLLEEITDTTWTDYIQYHFLDPLGMKRTRTSTKDLAKTKNVATPYYYNGQENIELNWVNWDNIAPAGAIISSVNDFAEWLKLNIHRGVYDEKRFISDSNFEEMTTLHVVRKISENSRELSPSKHFSGYGLGWSLMDYHGYKVLSHGGGYDGMISKSCVVPEKEIGLIILTNNLNWATGAIMNKTLDVLLNDEQDGPDWSELYLDAYNANEKDKKNIQYKSDSQRGKIGPMPFSQKEYVGTYTDKMYGDVIIYEKDGKLAFNMTRTAIFQAELEHWNLSTFTFHFDPNLVSLPEGKLWFKLNKNGEIESLKIDVPNPDFFFTELNFIKQNENN
jgi:CubicO group peptidase (beta-lactamase class C family)